jgi:hypothetical protein
MQFGLFPFGLQFEVPGVQGLLEFGAALLGTLEILDLAEGLSQSLHTYTNFKDMEYRIG